MHPAGRFCGTIKGINIDLFFLSTGTWNVPRRHDAVDGQSWKSSSQPLRLRRGASSWRTARSSEPSRDSALLRSRNWMPSSRTTSCPRKCAGEFGELVVTVHVAELRRVGRRDSHIAARLGRSSGAAPEFGPECGACPGPVRFWRLCSSYRSENRAKTHLPRPGGRFGSPAGGAEAGKKEGVHNVHTLGFGSGRTGVGLGRIGDVFGGVADFQGLECGSSPTSGTASPSSAGVFA